MTGTLHVVGTPIGNLDDITLRALAVLRDVALIAAEDTRVTARLLARHEIDTPTTSFREENAERAVPRLLARLEAGDDVALVTDAGTPSVSDPGARLVAAAAERQIPVSPIPGPSALAAAVSVAGLPGEGVRFVGFLTRKGPRRRRQLERLAGDPALQVLYESPRRLAATLEDLAAACGPRQAVVMRELTKVHEELARGDLADLAGRFAGSNRGEVTVVVAGDTAGADEPLTEERLRELVRARLGDGASARDVSADLSQALGIPRKQVYQLVLEELE